MNSGFQVFDTHTHVGTARHSGRSLRADQLLAAMDRFGVDRSVVIPFPVVEDYGATHDEIGRAVAAHPDRLVGAACIDPFVSEQAFRDEVRRYSQTLGFRALKLQPQYQALNPRLPRSEFFFETALENRLAAICHTGSGAPFAPPSLFIWPARKFPCPSFWLTAVVACSCLSRLWRLGVPEHLPGAVVTDAASHSRGAGACALLTADDWF